VNICFVLNNFLLENLASYKIMWNDMLERYRLHDNIIRCMRIACYIAKATNTHSQYVILFLHYNNVYTNSPQCYAIRT